jgi:hypothetical protein
MGPPITVEMIKKQYIPPVCQSVGSTSAPLLLACTGFAINCDSEGFPGCCLSEGQTCAADCGI